MRGQMASDLNGLNRSNELENIFSSSLLLFNPLRSDASKNMNTVVSYLVESFEP